MLAAHTALRKQHPTARLILVPRHPERFDSVAKLIQRSGHHYQRRSIVVQPDAAISVYLGDTMGELSTLIGLADIAYIGGSLVKVGGHNMLEAAAQGIPVCYGPYTHNFAQIAQQLLESGAAREVTDADSLAGLLDDWLQHPEARALAGQAGQTMVRNNQGAVTTLQQHIQQTITPEHQ